MTSPTQGPKINYPGHLSPYSSLNPSRSNSTSTSLSSSPINRPAYDAPVRASSLDSPVVQLPSAGKLYFRNDNGKQVGPFLSEEIYSLLAAKADADSRSSSSEMLLSSESTGEIVSPNSTVTSYYESDEDSARINEELMGVNPNQGLGFNKECLKEALAKLDLTIKDLDLDFVDENIWSDVSQFPTRFFDDIINEATLSQIASFKVEVNRALSAGNIGSEKARKIDRLFEIYYSLINEKKLLELVKGTFSQATSLVNAKLDWVNAQCLENLSDECELELKEWIRSINSKVFELFTENDMKNEEQVEKICEFFNLCQYLDECPQCELPARLVSCLLMKQIVPSQSLSVDVTSKLEFTQLCEALYNLDSENQARLIELSFSSKNNSVIPRDLFLYLEPLPNLKSLSVRDFSCKEEFSVNKFPASDEFEVASLKNLKSADFRFSSSVESPGKLLKFLPSVQTLSLRLNEDLPPEDLRAFCEHENLETLSFFQYNRRSAFYSIPLEELTESNEFKKGKIQEINFFASDTLRDNTKSFPVTLTESLFLSSHLFAKKHSVIVHINGLGVTDLASFAAIGRVVGLKDVKGFNLSAKSLTASRLFLTFGPSDVTAVYKEDLKKSPVAAIKV